MDDLISRAAAILIAESYGCNNGGVADCIASKIAALPAVDAVPVAWLEAHSREYYEDWGTEPVTVEDALKEWRKEQEART